MKGRIMGSRLDLDISEAIRAYDDGELTGAEFRAKIEVALESRKSRLWIRVACFAVIGACSGAILLAAAIGLGGDTGVTVQMIRQPTAYLGLAAKLGALAGAALGFSSAYR